MLKNTPPARPPRQHQKVSVHSTAQRTCSFMTQTLRSMPLAYDMFSATLQVKYTKLDTNGFDGPN